MNNNNNNVLQPWLALLTWLTIFIVSLSFLWESTLLYQAVLYQLLILVCIWGSTSESTSNHKGDWPRIALWLMLVFIFLLGWHVVHASFFIYSIIWIAVAAHHLKTRTCWLMLLVICLAWYLIRVFSWQDTNALTDTILVGMFHAFGLVSSLSSLKSAQANERAQELNRELTATQHLLSEVSKENERTRIARDLHDLLGHHLTALTINLQVAGHLSEGEAKEKVDQCHGLAKLLLSDVREAVSTLRETPILTLRELLELAVRDVPRLNIKLDIGDDQNVDDVNIAEVLLRSVQEAITNTLRHSNANNMLISCSRDNEKLTLGIKDDGKGGSKTQPGNGLAGMRERVERLNGELEFSSLEGFQINITLPLAGKA